jgi:hypothetical protein
MGLHHHQSHSIHREILLSIRFIFGETRKSRRLAKKLMFLELPHGARDTTFTRLIEGNLDNLFTGTSQKVGRQKLFAEQFLTPWHDFPLLGERLLEIQKYNEQQRPAKTRTMIRDKRQPAQWYTLWAVLLIGSLGLILSFLQLAATVVQVVYAVKTQPTIKSK